MNNKRSGYKQRYIESGGLFEIEYYGKPSQLKISDKRNHTPYIERIREELEIIFAEICDAEDELLDIINEWSEKKKVKGEKK